MYTYINARSLSIVMGYRNSLDIHAYMNTYIHARSLSVVMGHRNSFGIVSSPPWLRLSPLTACAS
jgi:hypothetical protein